MKKEVLFRTCVFGGYNKEDVLGYVNQLEGELERLKNMEKEAPQRPGAEVEESVEGDMIVFDERVVEHSGQIREAAGTASRKPTEDSSAKASSVKDSSAEEIHLLEEKLKKAGEELENIRKQLRDNERQMERKSRELEEKEWLLKKNDRELEEKEYKVEECGRQLYALRAECEELKKKHEAYEEDYRAIKNVLLNARVDAGIIVAKAQEKAKLILEEAQKNVQLETQKSVALLVDHLKENQEGLDVSKVYLEQQLKSIDDVKQQIEEIRSNIENMCWQTQGKQEEEKARDQRGPEVTIDEEAEDDFVFNRDVSDSDRADSEKAGADIV